LEKNLTRRKTGSNPSPFLLQTSLSLSYLQCHRNYLERRLLSLETRNKKHEEKKKIEQEKLEEKSLDIRDGTK